MVSSWERLMMQDTTPTAAKKMDASKQERPALILVVEDEPEIRVLLQKQLASRGFRPVCVANGYDALDWLHRNRADMVILDVMMPGIDGYEVCQRIRQRFASNTLPVLMLSALGGSLEDRVQGLNAGANDFLAKPYHLQELIARVNALLSVRASTDRVESLLAGYSAPAIYNQARLSGATMERNRHGHATILFADLRGFTRMTAHHEVANVVSLLDDYFDVMARTIERYGGVVFDIVGDELMAIFNLPDPVPFASYLAVEAACEMQRNFRMLQRQWARRGMEVGLGVGIHEGDVMVGGIGTSGIMRYTVIGTPVNVASRLQSLSQDGDIVISDIIMNALKNSPFAWGNFSSETAEVRGIEGMLTVYRTTINEN
jgi:adenylate cyclase